MDKGHTRDPTIASAEALLSYPKKKHTPRPTTGWRPAMHQTLFWK